MVPVKPLSAICPRCEILLAFSVSAHLGSAPASSAMSPLMRDMRVQRMLTGCRTAQLSRVATDIRK